MSKKIGILRNYGAAIRRQPSAAPEGGAGDRLDADVLRHESAKTRIVEQSRKRVARAAGRARSAEDNVARALWALLKAHEIGKLTPFATVALAGRIGKMIATPGSREKLDAEGRAQVREALPHPVPLHCKLYCAVTDELADRLSGLRLKAVGALWSGSANLPALVALAQETGASVWTLDEEHQRTLLVREGQPTSDLNAAMTAFEERLSAYEAELSREQGDGTESGTTDIAADAAPSAA